jgi:hypothetical protein
MRLNGPDAFGASTTRRVTRASHPRAARAIAVDANWESTATFLNRTREK